MSSEIKANKKLTISPDRLAGSPECMNCGTELMGPFCYYCGQPDKNLVRFFPALVRELLEDFMDFDSRFVRTIKPLLFKPGKLTRDYLDGRRFRYVPPLRLYIFSSIAMFFLFAVIAPGTIELGVEQDGDNPDLVVRMNESDKEDLREALRGLDGVQPGLAEQVGNEIEQAASGEEAQDDGESGEISFNINGEAWDPETNPVDIPLMPDWINDRLNKEIEGSPQKGRAIEENPNLMLDQVLEVLPGTMFVLLPLVALLLKLWYLFARKYYVEHLIFALHNHAFIFVTAIVLILLGVFTDWREPAGEGPMTTVMHGVKTLVLAWIPIYLLLSLKRVYQQGWGLTLAKYAAVSISYLVLLAITTAFVAVLSFVLL
ncbi:MAG: DUF3667 domain-containing protein [Xanthomonadales bacterium]|jgi:hypothetical protein|nr:DUF3667 domain-containing protein [Xanthomonadales bacterium]